MAKEISLGENQRVDSPVDPKPSQEIVKPGPTSNNAELVQYLLNAPSDQLIPWEDCVLPSRGIYYHSLVPDGKVKVKPFTINSEKIMSTSRLVQSGQSIDYVFKHHVKFPSNEFTQFDLLTGDWTYLFFFLRGISYGNEYEFSYTCPNEDCHRLNIYEYDLNQIQKVIKGPKHKEEPIKVILPYQSKMMGRDVWVEVRFLRHKDLKEISKREKNDKFIRRIGPKSASHDDSVIEFNDAIERHISLSVVSILGVKDPITIQEVVKKFHCTDTEAIKQVVDDDAPGFDSEITIKCPHCDNELKTLLPFTADFFRSKGSSATRRGV